MVLSTFAGANIIYAAVKRALNEETSSSRLNGEQRSSVIGGCRAPEQKNVAFSEDLEEYSQYLLSGEWHIHTNYSDGENSVDDYCKRAVELGT